MLHEFRMFDNIVLTVNEAFCQKHFISVTIICIRQYMYVVS